MISVNLTIEQLESIHCALFLVAADEVQQIRLSALEVIEGALGKTLELTPAANLLPSKFYLVDRSEVHVGSLERVLAGPFDTQEECLAERIGLHDGRRIVTLYVPPYKMQA